SIRQFKEQCLPVIEYYDARSLVSRIDGNKTKDEDYGFMHLSAGELLRQACSTAGSTYGEEIERHMKAGTIVPAKVTCGLLHQAMVQGQQSAGCINYLVDGFPRNEDNRTCWEADMGSKTVLKRVLVLDCPDDVCIDRCMKRHQDRIDDNEDTLKRR
ncbi:hypothetical protein AHF37_11376, partial [Paragonimus kellicotti]